MTDILFVGAGAVGGPIAAWLAEAGHRVRVVARGATADALEKSGIAWYTADSPSKPHVARVEVVRDLATASRPELVIVGVKTAALEGCLKELRARFDDRLLVVGLQNGIEVLRILPAIFPRSALAIVHFNAWPDAPGLYGVQKRGPLLVVPMPTTSDEETRFVADTLADATTASRARKARDAVLCKMVVNLAGSLQTLLALHTRPPDDLDALQWLLSSMMAEGVRTLKAAGVSEVKVPGTPPWLVMELAATLPRPLVRPLFAAILRKMKKSSLAQDVERGVTDTELDAIHGELVRLAETHGVEVPVMRTVLRLLEPRLSQRPFRPMQASEVAREARKG